MNTFDMISEPVLFIQGLYEYSHKVHQSVVLVQSVAEALLAEDHERVRVLREQLDGLRNEADLSKASLYGQIRDMRFHSAGGDAFSQYMACQDRIVDASQVCVEQMALRRTTIPAELRDDFRALVTEVVSVSGQVESLAQGLVAEAQVCGPEIEANDSFAAAGATGGDKNRVRSLETEFARRLYGLAEQIDPVTVMVLDKCRGTLHDVADNAEHAAEHLRLMIC